MSSAKSRFFKEGWTRFMCGCMENDDTGQFKSCAYHATTDAQADTVEPEPPQEPTPQ